MSETNLEYRVSELERDMREATRATKVVPVIERDVQANADDITELRDGMKDLAKSVNGVRVAILMFALSVAGSCIAILLTLTLGKP